MKAQTASGATMAETAALGPLSGSAIVFLGVFALLLAVNMFVKRSRRGRSSAKPPPPPGPTPWPILGSMHYLGMYEIPFEGFTYLKKFYGDVFSMRMGSTPCVVLNTPEHRDEAIVAKADDFDGRPNFVRFAHLFGGRSSNSLAFCNYSAVHEKRRALISHYSLPHSHSNSWERMNAMCQEECWAVESYVNRHLGDCGSGVAVLDLKKLLFKAAGNVFNRYFCDSPRYDYGDETFSTYVSDWEHVFWEVNTGRLCDFVPWTMFLSSGPIAKAKKHAQSIRNFVLNSIVAKRAQHCACGDEQEQVLLDYLLPSITGEKSSLGGSAEGGLDQSLDADMALYSLEDILGGSAAIACMAVRVIWDLIQNPDTAKEIRKEIDRVEASAAPSEESVYSMSHSHNFHWARAAIFETLRMTCSPIIPHRAIRDTEIGGYSVKEDTVVFINDHELNMSEKYWGGDAKLYRASRFLVRRQEASLGYNAGAAAASAASAAAGNNDPSVDLVFLRPPHFKPFSIGKRACMGYKIVETVTLALVIAVVKNFDLDLTEDSSTIKFLKGQLAVPLEPLELSLRRRRMD